MTPWSVRPRAGWPNWAARSARASIRQAPSSTEYSEWTCRWAQVMRKGEDTSGSRRLGAGDSSQPASCGCIAQVPHDRSPMNEQARTMRNVEQMKQGLIAGVRKRRWRPRRERDRQPRRWAFLAEAGQLLEDALASAPTMERTAT